jgi:phage tail-like protein
MATQSAYYSYPLKAYRFKVSASGGDANTLNGEILCSEVSGLDATLEEVEYRNGADEGIVKHKQHGLASYSNITLKRGSTDSIDWFNFIFSQVDGATKRVTLTIELLDDDKTTKAKWEVKQAWPVKWTGPDLNSTSSEVAFESIEICNEGIERVKLGG